jgi:hypothetical protein
MHKRWHKEYQHFWRLANAAKLRPDPDGSLPAAQAFAEALILCPDEAQAGALVKGDRAAASIFLALAEHYDDQFRKGVIEVANEPPKGSLPFFVMAGAVLEFLEGLRIRYPQGFGD